MDTLTNAYEIAKREFSIFLQEDYPFIVQEIKEIYKTVIARSQLFIRGLVPMVSELWYYTRWTLVIYYSYVAIKVFEESFYKGIFAIFQTTNESIARLDTGAQFIAWFIALTTTALLVVAPHILHYFLIRRPDILVRFLKKEFSFQMT